MAVSLGGALDATVLIECHFLPECPDTRDRAHPIGVIASDLVPVVEGES